MKTVAAAVLALLALSAHAATEGQSMQDTPITRVVNLLKEMGKTLAKDMDEDEGLYKKLSCWCNSNEYEKTEAIEAAQQKITELEASIEELTAKSAELKSSIKDIEKDVADNKEALAEATAIRKKQAEEFHSKNLDSIQGLENLKAAITVLSRHHDAAFPQLAMSFLSISSKEGPWSEDHESRLDNSFDEFLRHNGYDEAASDSLPVARFAAKSSQGFLQQDDAAEPTKVTGAVSSWSDNDVAAVRSALKSAAVFAQEHHEQSYYPSYAAQSGEILGILKQMEEEMGGDLKEAQELEAKQAAAFEELRKAKTQEIEEGEKMAEAKEAELAQTDSDLAEAKEDLEQTSAQLAEDEKFLANLKKTCKEREENFEERKKMRLAEIQAVTETIGILTADEARDAMSATYSFVQVSSKRESSRRAAARVLRRAAEASGNTEFSALASSVEMDAFTKVKAAIDTMIAKLKLQQEDEVKKQDYCKAEFHSNEMAVMKTQDLKADLQAKAESLESKVSTLEKEIEEGKNQILELQVALQTATETRVQESHDFQRTVADQQVTKMALKAALEKLASFYDQESLMQVKASRRQTPPVPEMEYKASSGASGVMSMIEKLIYEAKDLIADAKKAEAEAQEAYESLVADTNASVEALQKQVRSKTEAKAQAKKEQIETDEDLASAVNELEELAKYEADLHAECDYLLKNFEIRQTARVQEVEALQQAKQILSGADLA